MAKKKGRSSKKNNKNKSNNFDEIILPENTQSIVLDNNILSGYNTIDDRVITPRVFDRTLRNGNTKKVKFNLNENDEKENKINNKERKKDINIKSAFRDIRQDAYLKKIKTNEYENKQYNNELYQNKIYDNGLYTNQIYQNETNMKKIQYHLDETPKKSINIYSQVQPVVSSTPKKYKTPSENDMLQPDKTLIGNKCFTINNYVSPPKYLTKCNNELNTHFPLTGNSAIENINYRDLKDFFKSSYCLLTKEENEINKNEYQNEFENNETYIKTLINDTKKESNTHNWPYLDNGGDISQTPRKKILKNEVNFDNMKSPKKKKGSSLNTGRLLNQLSIMSPRNERTRNKTILIENENKNKKRKRESDNCNGEEVDDGFFINYEVKPIFSHERKCTEDETFINMDMLAKKKTNTVSARIKPYSKDLNVVFCDETSIPYKLIETYNALCYTLSRRDKLGEPAYFRLMKREMNNLLGNIQFDIHILKKIAWLAPNLVILSKIYVKSDIAERHSDIYKEFLNGKTSIEDVEIRENLDVTIELKKSPTLDNKKLMFQRIVLAWINVRHNDLLIKLNPKYYIPQYYELKQWHSKFDFNDIIYPEIKIREDTKMVRLSYTPHESNTDDFVVKNDSPLKVLTLEFDSSNYISEIEKEKTRTPLGRNRRKSNTIASFNMSPFSPNSPKKETKYMQHLRGEANKKEIITEIKNELEEEELKLASEKKYIENSKWIAGKIHEHFMNYGSGKSGIFDLKNIATSIYKSNENSYYKLNVNMICEIIESLTEYIDDISIKSRHGENARKTLVGVLKKNYYQFINPLILKENAINERYDTLKKTKEERLKQLFIKHKIHFELTDNLKKFFLNPGTMTLADL